MIVGKVEKLIETVLVSLKCFKMLCLVKLLFLSVEFGVFEEVHPFVHRQQNTVFNYFVRFCTPSYSPQEEIVNHFD